MSFISQVVFSSVVFSLGYAANGRITKESVKSHLIESLAIASAAVKSVDKASIDTAVTKYGDMGLGAINAFEVQCKAAAQVVQYLGSLLLVAPSEDEPADSELVDGYDEDPAHVTLFISESEAVPIDTQLISQEIMDQIMVNHDSDFMDQVSHLGATALVDEAIAALVPAKPKAKAKTAAKSKPSSAATAKVKAETTRSRRRSNPTG